jgi:hypothetical protein
MPRFTIKDLLLSAACISVGFALLGLIYRMAPGVNEVGLPIWFVGGMLVGAGVFVPFKRPGLGAIAGVVVQHWLFFIAVRVWGNTPVDSYAPLFIFALLLTAAMAFVWLVWAITRPR